MPERKLIYCPYTNMELESDKISNEHIFALSLGGINGFEIPVCKSFNSNQSSKIDSSLASDFLILERRNQLDIRGHSGKKPILMSKMAHDEETGKRLQVTIDRQVGIKVRCPVIGKDRNDDVVNINVTTMVCKQDNEILEKITSLELEQNNPEVYILSNMNKCWFLCMRDEKGRLKKDKSWPHK